MTTQHEDISVYPKILVVVLCQRIANGNTSNISNVNMVVEFPLEDLCPSPISNVQEQSVDLSYNLISTVNHKARRDGGHYTAIAKKANHWHCYNDEEVTISNFSCREENKTKMEFQRTTSILFYCQSPAPSLEAVTAVAPSSEALAEPAVQQPEAAAAAAAPSPADD